MPKPLAPITVAAPGFYGLNTQSAGGVIPAFWSSEMENIVFDASGRPAARKGSRRVNSTAISGEPKVKQLFQYIDGVGNTLEILSAGDKIYKNVGGTITNITGTATTPTASNWKFQNFNGKVVGAQRSHSLVVMTTIGGSFANVTLSGTQQPTTSVNEILSAYGRLWALDGTNLKYSDLLSHTAWNGVFDLSKYWRDGVDEGVALADWNGYLVVFGKRSIIVFNNPYDPASTMQIVENIGGFGCIARDSVQTVGRDILFLSRSGVRSLGRTIQEKSQPIGDVSKNVRDLLVSLVQAENVDNIRSVYSEVDGFYLLSLPEAGRTFCFDTRIQLEDGTYRVTSWGYSSDAIVRLLDGAIRLSKVKSGATRYGVSKYTFSRYSSGTGTGGYVSTYVGYLDEVNSNGTNGDTYRIKYASSWQDFGDQGVGNYVKMPKKLSFLIGGARGDTVLLKWGVNFSDGFNTASVTRSAGTVSTYGTARYTVSRYSGNISFSESKSPASGSGRTVRFGCEIEVDGFAVSIQDVNLYVKAGRLAA